MLYPAVTARLVPGIGSAGAHLMAFLLGVLLLVSLLLHHLGHVVACRAAGVTVTELTLSLPGHLEHEDPGTPRQAAVVAVGGPATSLTLFLSAMAGTSAPVWSMRSRIFELLIGQTSALCTPSKTKCNVGHSFSDS